MIDVVYRMLTFFVTGTNNHAPAMPVYMSMP